MSVDQERVDELEMQLRGEWGGGALLSYALESFTREEIEALISQGRAAIRGLNDRVEWVVVQSFDAAVPTKDFDLYCVGDL